MDSLMVPILDFRIVHMRAIALVLVTSLLLAAQAAPVTAQAPDGVDVGSLDRRIDTIHPTHGPPGTTVHVSTQDMPVITPIRVGFGAHGGFEALSELLTGDEGDFAVDIEVPDWATWDRMHLVLVFNIYFRPIARSVPFHVTDADGRIRRQGHVESAQGCVRFRDIDGVAYALTGDDAPSAQPSGAEPVAVEGRVVEVAQCGADVTIQVDRYDG
jgi:hypothetical protein